MGEARTGFVDFLEGAYGVGAIDQMTAISGLSREDIEKTCDFFVPAFLSSLKNAWIGPKSGSRASGATSSPLSGHWPPELAGAMQSLLDKSTDAARKYLTSSHGNKTAFPHAAFTDQTHLMGRLHQVFMGQVAQAQLIEDVARATGFSTSQLNALFPVLTTYGLLPLMPPPKDDPAAWIDYLGDVGRQNFRQMNRKLESLPNPLAAAFDGLLAGFFPETKSATQKAEPKQPMDVAEMQATGLALHASYLEGLNDLFRHYHAGLAPGNKNEDD